MYSHFCIISHQSHFVIMHLLCKFLLHLIFPRSRNIPVGPMKKHTSFRKRISLVGENQFLRLAIGVRAGSLPLHKIFQYDYPARPAFCYPYSISCRSSMVDITSERGVQVGWVTLGCGLTFSKSFGDLCFKHTLPFKFLKSSDL